MIDIIIDLAMTWWQFTVVGILIALGFIINLFGVDNKTRRIGFEYKEMSTYETHSDCNKSQ